LIPGWYNILYNKHKETETWRSLGFYNKENFEVLAMALGLAIAIILAKDRPKPHPAQFIV
jgi:predicted nuclease of predicted toxin-antitoxin system